MTFPLSLTCHQGRPPYLTSGLLCWNVFRLSHANYRFFVVHWTLRLPIVLLALHNTVSKQTSATHLVYGMSLRLPRKIFHLALNSSKSYATEHGSAAAANCRHQPRYAKVYFHPPRVQVIHVSMLMRCIHSYNHNMKALAILERRAKEFEVQQQNGSVWVFIETKKKLKHYKIQNRLKNYNRFFRKLKTLVLKPKPFFKKNRKCFNPCFLSIYEILNFEKKTDKLFLNSMYIMLILSTYIKYKL